MRQQSRRTRREKLDSPGQHIIQGRAGAAVRNVGDEHAGGQLEGFNGQVSGAGIACRCIVDLARPCFHIRNEGLEVLHRDILVHHEQAGHAREQGNGYKILVHVVTAIGVNERVHRHQADVAHHDGVAICRRTRGLLHGGHAAATAFVVDHKSNAQLFGELSRNRSGHDAGGAAGCKRHDPADGFAGPDVLTKTRQALQSQASRAHPFKVISPL